MKSKQKIAYLLGIDGGGTKTEFLLTDLDDNEIKRIILGASNPVNAGFEAAAAVLKSGIEAVCQGINPEEISVFAGIAGSSSKVNKDKISLLLADFGFGAYANGCDTDSTLQAALSGENGTAIIMGTGIIALSRLNGETHRTGGWGYLIDKGGSGFCIGSDVLNAAFEFLDGRGGSELIFRLTEEKLGKPLADSISDIYGGGAAYVASFAPVAFEAYKNGDTVAENILDRNAREATKIIKTGYEFSKGKAVICGGLCRQKDILKPLLLKYLGEDFPLEFSDKAAIEGAVALAKEVIIC